MGASYEQSNYTNYGTNPSWLNFTKNPEYEKTKLYTKLTYLFGRGDHRLSLFINHTQHTGDAGRPNRDYIHFYDTLNLVYSNQISSDLNLQAKVGFRNYNRRWAEDNYPTDFSLREHDGMKENIIPADITVNYRHMGNSMLTAGVDGQVVNYKTYAEINGVGNTGNDVSAYSAGLFLQEKLVIDRLVLRVGGRFNHTHHSYDQIGGVSPGVKDKSWNKFLWSVGARYNALPQVAVYANSGSSFVAPSAKSVGGTLLASDFGVPGKNGQLPNPGLKPESGIGSDLGVDLRPTETLKIGFRGFYTMIDDMILDNSVSTIPSQSRSINAGKAKSYGVEVDLEQLLGESLQWFANLTYSKSTVDNPLDADNDGTEITFVPDYVSNLGVTARLSLDITLSSYLQMVGTYYDSTSRSGRKEFGDYQTVNLKLQKELVKRTDYTMVAAVDINNLFNRKYEMPWQFRDPGFNAFGSLELRF